MLSVLVLGNGRTLWGASAVLAGTGEDIRFTLVSSVEEARAELNRSSFDLLVSMYSPDQGKTNAFLEELRSRGMREPVFVMVPGKGDSIPVNGSQPLDSVNGTTQGERTRDLFARLGARISRAVERSTMIEHERENQARICSILASINTGVFIVDEYPGRILHVNEYALQMMDVPKEGIIGLDYRDRLRADRIPALADRLPEEGVLQSEGVLIGNAGREIPVIFNITPVPLHGSRNLLITFLDNSNRKRAEKALAESETLFRNLVEASPDAILLTDLDGNILKANENAVQLFGYAAGELHRGVRIDDLHPSQGTLDWRSYRERLFATGLVREEHLGRSRAGGEFPLEISSSIIHDTGGRPFSVIHVIRDITERKEAEQALMASEERYRHVVEDQTEFICRFLPDGTHVFVNEAYCRYFGRTRGDIVGTRFIPRIHPDDRKALREHFASLSPDHPVGSIDHRISMADGKIRWQRWSDRAIFDPGGSLIEYQSVGRDITEWKEAELALKFACASLTG